MSPDGIAPGTAVFLLAISGGLATGLGIGAGQVTTDPIYVHGCLTIDSSGSYQLPEDMENDRTTRLSQTCIRITADNVVFDGQGHLLQGRGISDTTGLSVVNATNVTVQDLELRDWNRGVHVANGTNVTIDRIRASRNARGVDLSSAKRTTLSNSSLSNNLIGVGIDADSRNVSLTGNSMVDNSYANVSRFPTGTGG